MSSLTKMLLKKVLSKGCLLVLFLFITPQAQWSNDPAVNTPVCDCPGRQLRPLVTQDGKGGYIFMWEDERNGWRDIYAQRLDSNGFKMWDSLGVPVAVKPSLKFVGGIISDGEGGAIIAWDDRGDFPTNPTDLYIQRLDSNGNLIWNSGGVAIANSPASELFGSMVLDINGGVYVSYIELDSGIVFTHHLDAKGNFLWGPPPPRIGGFLIPDNHGGFIAVSGGRRAQRYDSLAQKVWGDTGILYSSRGTSILDSRLIEDSNGGFIVTWLDYDGVFNYDIYAQRVDSLGNRLWGDEGVLVGSQANNATFSPSIAPDEQGGAIIGWEYPGSGLGFVSRISTVGLPLWGPEGISDTGSVYYVVSDLKGGAIYNRSQFFAQHIDSSGQIKWGNQGVKVTTRNVAGSFAPISDGRGGVLFYWDEFDIYCQLIDKDGNLGGKTDVEEEEEQRPLIPRQFTLYQNYPNPFNSFTIIKFSTKRVSRVELSIFNILGEKIKKIVDGVMPGGEHTVVWDGTNQNREEVSSGIYLYQLKVGELQQTKKLTLLK